MFLSYGRGVAKAYLQSKHELLAEFLSWPQGFYGVHMLQCNGRQGAAGRDPKNDTMYMQCVAKQVEQLLCYIKSPSSQDRAMGPPMSSSCHRAKHGLLASQTQAALDFRPAEATADVQNNIQGTRPRIHSKHAADPRRRIVSPLSWAAAAAAATSPRRTAQHRANQTRRTSQTRRWPKCPEMASLPLR